MNHPLSAPPLLAANIITLFPEAFPGLLGVSLAGKALQDGLWHLATTNLRDFGVGAHKNVDDTPYGGGAGMVLRADVLSAALAQARASLPKPATPRRTIYLSPRGRPLTQSLAQELAGCARLVLLCGRYEGVDQRVLEHDAIEEISIGDYVLMGGEVAAMVLLEAVVRLLPGVLGNSHTTSEESFSAGLLEYPHYTRPPEWQGQAVPPVLLSGNHAEIKLWRQQQAEKHTQGQRPDLWAKYRRQT